MPMRQRGIWKAMGFTAFFLLLVALAIGSINPLHLTVFLSLVLCSIAFLLSVFPGSRFFTIAMANFIALYACIFNFLVTSNFSTIEPVFSSIGFILPMIGFFGGTWLHRKNIKSIVLAHQLPAARGFRASIGWLFPITGIGLVSFFFPRNLFPLIWEEVIFFVAMGGIALVVLFVSKQIATFLLDCGLLFEAFFLRIEPLIVPAFAFLTFYSMNVMVFGFIYRILDHYSSEIHFTISGEARAISFMESLYFSIITLSTVGYGDIVPRSDVARSIVSLQIVVSVMLLLFGFSEIMSYSRSRNHQK
ncbi:potassium channel family protein [Kiloniella laminariae]|uniref:Potassium channel family protein n=1 Tax=Kiloniella laminariae TaxID=454162 RepID=A0ABT4LPE6_9PROT|nr:potassium channel family protein [Kiloniella laminariae]MCZ4282971.1 potassium channel family protein [Kiloniella laminariae]